MLFDCVPPLQSGFGPCCSVADHEEGDGPSGQRVGRGRRSETRQTSHQRGKYRLNWESGAVCTNQTLISFFLRFMYRCDLRYSSSFISDCFIRVGSLSFLCNTNRRQKCMLDRSPQANLLNCCVSRVFSPEVCREKEHRRGWHIFTPLPSSETHTYTHFLCFGFCCRSMI